MTDVAKSVFWTALVVGFLALAVVAWRERAKVQKVEHPFASELPHALIPTPVAAALTRIQRVEAVGSSLRQRQRCTPRSCSRVLTELS